MHSSPSLWTRHSSILLAGFLLIIFLLVYVWWPLAEAYFAFVDWSGAWWRYIDWLLIGIFLFMSLTIVAGADLKRDSLIVFVGIFGGLAIESWGTQTNLWQYYTAERPPLWIIPAWPIASLSIDRITRVLNFIAGRAIRSRHVVIETTLVKFLYWLVFPAFLIIMFSFVQPTITKTYTALASLLCILLVLRPVDERNALFIFAAGAGLGYFLELWGTTRECWVYYTGQKPPLFSVLAHGMASVAFWRAAYTLKWLIARALPLFKETDTIQENLPERAAILKD